MAILTRIKRLFKADVHALLDAVEDPEALLKQSIREMEESVEAKRLRYSRLQQRKATLINSQQSIEKELEQIEIDLKFCLKENSEDLGRRRIGRKLTLQPHLARIRQAITDLDENLGRLGQQIQTEQDQLDSVVEKARLFAPAAADDSAYSTAPTILAGAEGGVSPITAAGASAEEIELEWIRMKQGAQKGESS